MGEEISCDGLARSPVPVGCIREITFLPMQISVHPGALTVSLDHLNKAVSLLPVVTGVPPKCLQR